MHSSSSSSSSSLSSSAAGTSAPPPSSAVAATAVVSSSSSSWSSSSSSSLPAMASPPPPLASTPTAAEKLAKAEALLLHLSQVHSFHLVHDGLLRDASRLFSETKHHLLSTVASVGCGSEEGLIKCWSASLIYCAFKLGRPSQSIVGFGGFTLTKLLKSLKFEVMDFLRELSYFLSKSSQALMSIYGETFNAFQQQLRQLQANYVHLAVLYQNYKKNFSKFFHPPNEIEGKDNASIGSCVDAENLMYLRFGWMLFLALRMHVPGHFVDLMTCANGLIAIFVVMIIHMPARMRNVSLDDSSTYSINTPRGVDIVASLCKLYDASEADVRAMLERVNSMIQSHIDSKDILGTVEKEKFMEGIDTDGLMRFKRLMEKQDIITYLKILDKNYVEVYHRQGDIDERSFLPENSFVIDLISGYRNGSDEPSWTRSAKRKYEMISSPSKPIALRVKVPTEDDSLLLSPNSGISKMPPPTPVSVSMATAKWLRTVIAPLPAEPSIELLNFFKSCDTDITKDVIYRAHLLLECAFSVEVAKNSVTGGANAISSLTSAWALHRRIEALKLYYRVLHEMCKAEAKRLQSDNLSSLLTNERFHRCMLACCAEIVLATHKTISMAFPAVLEPMGITAFDLSKMIESFVRHEETLPRELKRHLNSIEERFLEMLAWEKGSSMYNSLIIARPYLKFHIQRLGLLGDPMPSLETLKFRFQSSKDTLRSVKTEGNASPATRNIKREVENGSLLLSPIRDRTSAFSVFSPTKAITQPPLQSAFASPHRIISAGGSETCAETVIGIFFHKVLKLSAIRIKLLVEALKHPAHLMEDVFKLVSHLLHEETHIFFNRHIDQIVLCSLYGVCKVKQLKLTFKEIVQTYRQMPQNKSYVFRTVFLDSKGGSQETGDIIQFYNAVFIPLAKSFLIELSSRAALSANDNNEDKNRVSHGSSPFSSLPDASPKKVSANHNVYVSPLKASKVLSPHSRRLYACFGESTHEYQSPSKDLSEINKRLMNHRKLGRLDFADVSVVNDSVVAKDLISQNWALK